MLYVALLGSRWVHFLCQVFIISTILMSCKTLMWDVLCIVNQPATVSFILHLPGFQFRLSVLHCSIHPLQLPWSFIEHVMRSLSGSSSDYLRPLNQNHHLNCNPLPHHQILSILPYFWKSLMLQFCLLSVQRYTVYIECTTCDSC